MPGYNVFVSRSASFVVVCFAIAYRVSKSLCCLARFFCCVFVSLGCVLHVCFAFYICFVFCTYGPPISVLCFHVFVLCSASLCCVLRLCIVFPDLRVVTCDYVVCFRIFVLCFTCLYCVSYVCFVFCTYGPRISVLCFHMFVLCSASLCCALRLCIVFPDFCVVSCNYVLCFRIFVLCIMCLYCVSYVCFVFCTCGPPYETRLQMHVPELIGVTLIGNYFEIVRQYSLLYNRQITLIKHVLGFQNTFLCFYQQLK